MHLINQICAIMQNCIQKEKSGRCLHIFLSTSTLDVLFFSSSKSSFGTFGTKGTTTEEGRPPERSTINNTQSRNFFCYNLSLSIIRQKDFLLFSLSKILPLSIVTTPCTPFNQQLSQQLFEKKGVRRTFYSSIKLSNLKTPRLPI